MICRCGAKMKKRVCVSKNEWTDETSYECGNCTRYLLRLIREHWYKKDKEDRYVQEDQDD